MCALSLRISAATGKRSVGSLSTESLKDNPYGVLAVQDQMLSLDWMTGYNGPADPIAGPLSAERDSAEFTSGEPAPSSDGRSEQCVRCQGRMHVSELELICASCGYTIENEVTEDSDDGPKKAAFHGRLRIVGPNCGRYQPDLDRSSSSSNNTAAQIRQIYDEYLMYRGQYITKGGRAFPEEACNRAAQYYHEVQENYVKRSQNKLAIMASYLWHACLEFGFVPTKSEIAELMQLPKRGIARGENFLRMMASEGQTSIDVNKNPCTAHVATVFLHLNLLDEKYVALQPAVEAIVDRAVRDLVGTSSTQRSKVNGAAFVVLQRHASVTGTRAISLQDFCQRCSIRKNTIEQFTSALADFHSHFEDIYREYGLEVASRRKPTISPTMS